MTILAATTDGVFRADESGFADAEQVLSDRHAYVLERSPGGDAFAATTEGLYRSTDEGLSWTACGLPEGSATALLTTGDRVYAGTDPARVYVSDDRGDSWRELDGLRDVESFDQWEHAAGGPAQIRSLAVAPGDSDRLLAGVESAGACRSDDGGETWRSVREGLHDDVHHLLALDRETYLAATGDGLYRSENAGKTWIRRDTDRDLFDFSYGRESIAHEGTVYTALSASPPFWDDDPAVLLVSHDDGETFERVEYPGDSTEFVISWTTDDDRVFAGTSEGTVFAGAPGRWDVLGTVPVSDRARGAYGVTSLAVV